MIRHVGMILGAMLASAAASAATSDPFAQPVKDCHPCRFSPGPGQPDIDLTFVFNGTGDAKALVGLEVRPVGGKTQLLDPGSIAVSDFPDGFSLDTTDMNFDGMRDLSITTMLAANNSSALYWIYRPQSHDFTPLKLIEPKSETCGDYALVPMADHTLLCHIHGSAIEHVDYIYRVDGDRAVAVREEIQKDENGVVFAAVFDLTVTPKHQIERKTVGFVGDSPARTAFLSDLDAASKRAAIAYRKSGAAAAVAVLAPLLKDKYPEALGAGDDDDRKLAAQLNDYGFYLAEAGRAKEAIDVLQAVIGMAPGRVVAYLNLADAQFAAGDKPGAKTNYADYQKRLIAGGKGNKVPPRVAERLR